MPSSAGLWAAAYAEGLLDAADAVHGFWQRLDRSPLGSAAGYGVPLPLVREASAKALGFPIKCEAVTAISSQEMPLPAKRPLDSRLTREKALKLLGHGMATEQGLRESVEHVLSRIQKAAR